MAISLSGISPAALADEAAAEALFQEAKTLAGEGRFDQACPKFAASYGLDATLGTLLNLADCYEQQGAIAKAWSRFGEAEQLAAKLSDDRQSYAKDRRAALEGRVPKLTVEVRGTQPDYEVLRDNEVLASTSYGLALPVDPGGHRIQIRREGQILKEIPVEISEGGAQVVAVDLDELERTYPRPLAPPPSTGSLTPDDEVEMEFWTTQRTAGLVVGLVGVAGGIVFASLEGIAASTKSEASEPDNCSAQGVCTPEGASLMSDAETLAEVGQWVGIGSLIVFATGATLFLTASSEPVSKTPPSTGRVDLLPIVGPTSWGVAVRGTL